MRMCSYCADSASIQLIMVLANNLLLVMIVVGLQASVQGMARETKASTDSGTCSADDGCENLNFSVSPSTSFHRKLLSMHRQADQKDVLAQDIFISIKTTSKYHSTRLPPILFTWLQSVYPPQVHLVTDRNADRKDRWLVTASDMGFRVVYADCETGHQRDRLCCKSGVEFHSYYFNDRKSRWYCHFDDDVYVNVPNLERLLSKYDPARERVYLGRWPLAADSMAVNEQRISKTFPNYKKEAYRYATGAAFCISSSLMNEVEEYLSGEQFGKNCDQLKLTDDMLVGCVIGAVLGYNLTNELTLNSNLNPMQRITKEVVKQQITVSYGEWRIQKNGEQITVPNALLVPNAIFSESVDPTRFFSHHCYLFPDTRWCND